MCTSRYHRVRRPPDEGKVELEDVTGRQTVASLLAWAAADLPRPGDWIVVHSGYALGPADREEAESAAQLYQK